MQIPTGKTTYGEMAEDKPRSNRLLDAWPASGPGGDLLDALHRETKGQLTATLELTAPRLDDWAKRYPEINRSRILPLVMSVAAATPFCDARAVESTARMSLWVFTLDDLFDERRCPDGELFERAKRYQVIAISRSAWPAGIDSLGTALAEVKEDLASYELFPSLEEQWAVAVCQTIQAMMVEHRWSGAFRLLGAEALPSYEEYVENGLYSIGGPPHVWSALITIGDPDTPNALGVLRRMERLASTCIRLANDLRSEAKEALEGKVNAFTILKTLYGKDGASATEAAELAHARVRSEIAKGLADLRELEGKAVTRTGLPEKAIAGIARFVCDFYAEHDYHTFLHPSHEERVSW